MKHKKEIRSSYADGAHGFEVWPIDGEGHVPIRPVNGSFVWLTRDEVRALRKALKKAVA